MRISSRVAVGSPTARLSAILAATLLLAMLGVGAVVAGASYLSGTGSLIVDPNDPSAYPTITAAVDAAEDGDTILVRPGVYPESVTVSEDVTLRGDGEREDVVIEIPSGGPTFPTEFGPKFFGLVIQDSEAEVSGLTVRSLEGADPTLIMGVAVDGGAPRVHDVTSAAGVNLAVWLTGGSGATVSDSDLGGYVISRGSGAITILRNTVLRHIDVDTATGVGQPIVRQNHAAGVNSLGPILVEGNILRLTDLPDAGGNSEFLGIDVGGEGWIVKGNDLSGFETAIDVRYGGSGAIEANQLSDNSTGMLLRTGDVQVVGNTVRGGETGIRVQLATATLTDNTVEGAEVGVEIGAISPTLSGNVLCGNGVNLSVADGAEPVLETNEICEDGLVTATE